MFRVFYLVVLFKVSVFSLAVVGWCVFGLLRFMGLFESGFFGSVLLCFAVVFVCVFGRFSAMVLLLFCFPELVFLCVGLLVRIFLSVVCVCCVWCGVVLFYVRLLAIALSLLICFLVGG